MTYGDPPPGALWNDIRGWYYPEIPMTEMPKAATIEPSKQDAMRNELSKIETAVLKSFMEIEQLPNFSPRWLNIARTNVEQGFMAAKRSIYEGKRVGDP